MSADPMLRDTVAAALFPEDWLVADDPRYAHFKQNEIDFSLRGSRQIAEGLIERLGLQAETFNGAPRIVSGPITPRTPPIAKESDADSNDPH